MIVNTTIILQQIVTTTCVFPNKRLTYSVLSLQCTQRSKENGGIEKYCFFYGILIKKFHISEDICWNRRYSQLPVSEMAHIKLLSLFFSTSLSLRWLDLFRSRFPLGDTSETKVGGCAVRSILATCCTSVSVTVRLERGERKQQNLPWN